MQRGYEAGFFILLGLTETPRRAEKAEPMSQAHHVSGMERSHLLSSEVVMYHVKWCDEP